MKPTKRANGDLQDGGQLSWQDEAPGAERALPPQEGRGRMLEASTAEGKERFEFIM